MNPEQLWQSILGEIEINLSRANFVTWFKNTYLETHENNRLVICVPNTFTKTWLEQKYYKEIATAYKNIIKDSLIEVIYKIETRKPENFKKENGTQPTIIKPIINKQNTINRFGLNSRYTFNNFIVGKNNELAFAACQAVATNPGQAYNPLVIYGGVGLGKTHLLQAIGNELAKQTDKILYVTSEKFSNEYINEVRGGRAKTLKDKYRNVDLLLVDDIQFMGGKDGTQQEFFHTFNELHQTNKQIVVTSDQSPKNIPALEKRLISRLEWGMVADITQPDIETRIAILQTKCTEKNFHLPADVLSFIAEKIENNIRELEGSLNKLITYYEFNNLTPSIETAKHILFDFFSEITKTSITPKQIIETVTKFYDINIKDILGNCRRKELALPRQIIMYLMRQETKLSFPSIGEELGGRDHTTAMHGNTKIEREIEENEKLKQEINSLKKILKTTVN